MWIYNEYGQKYSEYLFGVLVAQGFWNILCQNDWTVSLKKFKAVYMYACANDREIHVRVHVASTFMYMYVYMIVSLYVNMYSKMYGTPLVSQIYLGNNWTYNCANKIL